jgi:hypothetical protein
VRFALATATLTTIAAAICVSRGLGGARRWAGSVPSDPCGGRLPIDEVRASSGPAGGRNSVEALTGVRHSDRFAPGAANHGRWPYGLLSTLTCRPGSAAASPHLNPAARPAEHLPWNTPAADARQSGSSERGLPRPAGRQLRADRRDHSQWPRPRLETRPDGRPAVVTGWAGRGGAARRRRVLAGRRGTATGAVAAQAPHRPLRERWRAERPAARRPHGGETGGRRRVSA